MPPCLSCRATGVGREFRIAEISLPSHLPLVLLVACIFGRLIHTTPLVVPSCSLLVPLGAILKNCFFFLFFFSWLLWCHPLGGLPLGAIRAIYLLFSFLFFFSWLLWCHGGASSWGYFPSFFFSFFLLLVAVVAPSFLLKFQGLVALPSLLHSPPEWQCRKGLISNKHSETFVLIKTTG